jgi:hypothetical protein
VHGKSGWKQQASVSFVDEPRDEGFLSLVKLLCAVVNSCAGARIAGSGGRMEGQKERRDRRAFCSVKKKKKKKKKESSRDRETRHSSHSIAPLSMITDGPRAIYRFSQQCRDDKTNQLIASQPAAHTVYFWRWCLGFSSFDNPFSGDSCVGSKTYRPHFVPFNPHGTTHKRARGSGRQLVREVCYLDIYMPIFFGLLWREKVYSVYQKNTKKGKNFAIPKIV